MCKNNIDMCKIIFEKNQRKPVRKNENSAIQKDIKNKKSKKTNKGTKRTEENKET